MTFGGTRPREPDGTPEATRSGAAAPDSNAGFLLTRRTEHVDLGTHQGHRIVARVERRMLRVALGGPFAAPRSAGERSPRTFAVALGRLRPTSVHVAGPAGAYERLVPAVPSAWAVTPRRLALAWAVSLAILALARLLRGRDDDGAVLDDRP